MTDNAMTIFEFLKSHPGEEMTKQAIAAEVGLSVQAVSGTVNSLVKKGLCVDRIEATEKDGKPGKPIHYHMLTDEGLAYDPVAAEEAKRLEKIAKREAAKAEKE